MQRKRHKLSPTADPILNPAILQFGGEWMHVSVWLSPLAVHLKLSQHCLSVIPQYKTTSLKKKVKLAILSYRYTRGRCLLTAHGSLENSPLWIHTLLRRPHHTLSSSMHAANFAPGSSDFSQTESSGAPVSTGTS